MPSEVSGKAVMLRQHTLMPILLFIGLLHASGLRSAVAQPRSDEYQVKAAFLFHFAQLVEWPPDAFSGSEGSLVLCTLEDDAFYDELENSIEGRQIGPRTIRVRQVHVSQASRSCNLVFISNPQAKRLPSILAALRNLPVLTVGETDDFLGSGGMIRFRIVNDKLRFDINLTAADTSHLKISSQLLLLSNSVSRVGTKPER